jgi:methylthioribulose-1-phosphate dehydratase
MNPAPAPLVPTDLADTAPLAVRSAICAVGAEFHRRGWSLATSSNYSVVLRREPFRLLITGSGLDKSRLGPADLLVLDGDGRPVAPTDRRPSAETALHLALARQSGVGAVLHTHSVWGTVLSEVYAAAGGFALDGFEMLKGLAGVRTHEHHQWVAILPNTQDIPALADDVRRQLGDPERPLRHGFLIRRHGLYTWGGDLDEARRHVEVFEFLFEVAGRLLR